MANANCTATHLTSALKPLHDAFGLEKVFVVTMQAVSGGYPGVSTMDISDNVIPYIGNEAQAGGGAAEDAGPLHRAGHRLCRFRHQRTATVCRRWTATWNACR